MNSVDAARVIATLQGAFPYAKVDDATVMVWANALDVADYPTAMRAASRWIEEMTFFPTVKDFNGMMTDLRREARDTAAPQRALMGTAIRCNGSGWFDRGKGQEPCPTCNPWLRGEFLEGKLDKPGRIPTNYFMPEPCQPSHAGEGPIVSDRRRAMQLVIGGLREQLTEDGLTPEQIDEVVERRMPTVMAVLPSGDGAATD